MNKLVYTCIYMYVGLCIYVYVYIHTYISGYVFVYMVQECTQCRVVHCVSITFCTSRLCAAHKYT